jgi:hypothetical protein
LGVDENPGMLLAHGGQMDPDIATPLSAQKAFLKQNALFFLQIKKRVSLLQKFDYFVDLFIFKRMFLVDAAIRA